MPYLLVDPSSVLDFRFDWSDWLGGGSPSDTISSRQWTISPQAGSPLQPSLTNATSAVVEVEGMRAGRVYRLTEHIVTAAGLEEERSVILRCDDT